jgi:hypothetical protein
MSPRADPRSGRVSRRLPNTACGQATRTAPCCEHFLRLVYSCLRAEGREPPSSRFRTVRNVIENRRAPSRPSEGSTMGGSVRRPFGESFPAFARDRGARFGEVPRFEHEEDQSASSPPVGRRRPAHRSGTDRDGSDLHQRPLPAEPVARAPRRHLLDPPRLDRASRTRGPARPRRGPTDPRAREQADLDRISPWKRPLTRGE